MMHLFLFALSVQSHNWIFGDSRAAMASQSRPAPPRAGARLPHRQVGANQDFVVEWSTGHGGDYYFVVVKATDEGMLEEHTPQTLQNYIAEAPASAYVYEDVRYERIHVSYNNNENNGAQYERRLDESDPRYIDRSPFHPEGSNYPQWKYLEGDLQNDAKVSYFNPKYPWIEAMYRYAVNAPHWANERDSSRISIPARGGLGEYVVHMVWKGYRDAIDVDVLSQPANDIYGRLSDTKRWVKTEHCWYPNLDEWKESRCTYRQAGEMSVDAIKICDEKGEKKCNALNCVPLFAPKTLGLNGWDSPLDAHVPWTLAEDEERNRCTTDSIPDDADENTYVCYGLLASTPKDPAFNIQTEDFFYVRDEDPEDPIYYSQCFRFTQERIFDRNGGNVDCQECQTEEVEPVQRWQIGDMCRTCEDLDTFDPNPRGFKHGLYPQWPIQKWALTETCERCF